MSIDAQAEDLWRGRIEAFLPLPMLRDSWPPRRRLKGARLVYPLYHGDGCAGLSGLYAIVNAVRIVMAQRRPIRDKEADMLVELGLHFLETHMPLARCSALGMRFQLWSRLAHAVVAIVERRFNHPVFIEQPFRGARSINRDEMMGILETAVVRQKAAIIMRRGCMFSVVTGYTPSSLLLADSGGARFIRRASCSIVKDTDVTRHRLCPWSITLLSSI